MFTNRLSVSSNRQTNNYKSKHGALWVRSSKHEQHCHSHDSRSNLLLNTSTIQELITGTLRDLHEGHLDCDTEKPARCQWPARQQTQCKLCNAYIRISVQYMSLITSDESSIGLILKLPRGQTAVALITNSLALVPSPWPWDRVLGQNVNSNDISPISNIEYFTNIFNSNVSSWKRRLLLSVVWTCFVYCYYNFCMVSLASLFL